jgi:hypothetical protein
MIPHIMIIQAAYTDRRLSERRLEISRHTAIPSLAYQTVKPVIHIAVNPDDPFLAERLDAFRSTGCEVKPLYRPNWKLYRENWELPEGRKIVSRMDDDDVICKEYCQRTREAAPESGEWNLIWPNGYVFWRETCYLLHHPGIQFVTLVTDHDKDPHQEQHWGYHKRWQTKVVSNAVGWIWVRHGDAASSTLPRYRRVKQGGIDAKRIPINLRAILRAIADSGTASGNYTEHRNPALLAHVLQQNKRHEPTAPAGPRFLVVVPTHRMAVAQATIDKLQMSLTYPTEFHILDGTPSKCHALNKALAELVDPARHDIYVTIDDDILPGENWQHFVACAFDRIPKLGACGVDYSGTDEGRALMSNAMNSPVQQVRDIQFRDATGFMNLAGGCFAIRSALAKEIGPYPFADDGRQYHADEDGWRSHQVTRRGWKVGYVTNPNEPVRMITHENTEQYIQTKAKDVEAWQARPVWS